MPRVPVAAMQAATLSPFVLSLSNHVVAPTSERATWFDRLTTNGGWVRSWGKIMGQSITLAKALGAPITRRSTAAVPPVAVGWG